MSRPVEQSTKRQLICEAAARLFRDKGYSATSMRDLAREVNLNASSLYNHISSKEEILRHICFENARQFLSGMQQIEELEGSNAIKVRELLRLHIRIATEEVTSVTAFNDEWRHLSEPHLSEFRELRRNYEQRFRMIIEAGVRSGEFKPLDPSVILFTLLSSIRWLYDWYRRERKESVEAVENNIITLIMEGMEKDGK